MNLNSIASDSDSEGDGDEALFRSQAAALAQALRQADEAQRLHPQRQPQPQQMQSYSTYSSSTTPALAYDTYRQLCFDDPVVSSAGCMALAKALTVTLLQPSPSSAALSTPTTSTPTSCLAISNPLIRGIAQLCYRQSQAQLPQPLQTPQPHPPSSTEPSSFNLQSVTLSDANTDTTPDDNDSNNNNSNNIEQPHAMGTALLAWTVYGIIPLRLLQAQSLAQAAVLLGTFRAVATATTDTSDDRAPNHKDLNDHNLHSHNNNRNNNYHTPVNSHPSNNQRQPQQLDDNDSLQEVWAAESDPSDFDYGSEPTPAQRLTELDFWIADPTELSQVAAAGDIAWQDVAAVVTQLLTQLSYSQSLAGLVPSNRSHSSGGSSRTMWKQQQISDHLTQLTLTLVLPSSSHSPLLDEYDHAHWQQLALYPLHAFRDAVDHAKTQTTAEATTLLQEYCSLLVLLLQANHHARPLSSHSSSPSNSVAPATLIGLGTLATLCNSCLEPFKLKSQTNQSASQTQSNLQLQRLRMVQETIFRVVDDLAALLETTKSLSEVVVPWTCLSLWQVVTTATTNAVPSSSFTSSSLTPTQAQRLLQAGIMSQWMLSWQRHYDKVALCVAMEESIFGFVCVSPTLLGKYVWRFTNFAAIVTNTTNETHHHDSSDDNGEFPTATQSLGSVFLWNLVGIHLATLVGGGGSGGLVSLKRPGNRQPAAASPAPSASTCRDTAKRTFQLVCSDILSTLQEWKARRESLQDADDKDLASQSLENARRIFDSFQQIVDALSIPLVRLLFLQEFGRSQSVSPGHATSDPIDTVSESVATIRQLLMTWPPSQSVDQDSKATNSEGNTVSQSTKADEKAASATCSEDDGDFTRQHGRGRMEVENEQVSNLRRAIKVFQSTIESGGPTSGIWHSSKAD